MAETRILHRFSCSEETFWNRVCFENEYNRRLFLEELGFPSYRLIELQESEKEVVRAHEITPKVVGLPAPIAALIGESFSYFERDVFTRATRRMTISVTPSKLARKLDIQGDFYTEPEGDGRCRRIFECRAVCKLLGVGGMVEKHILADVRRDYDVTAAFTERYLAEKGLV